MASIAESSLLASTYLGGSGIEGWQYSGAVDVAIADSGEVYVVGITSSADYPTTPGVFECVDCGDDDVFIAKLSDDLSTLLASTIIGGSLNEFTPSVTVSSDGTIYVTGHTSSTDFPTTVGAYDASRDAGRDIFVARFDADLASLLAATYLGGNGDETSLSIDLDHAGDVVVCGLTTGSVSNSFPTTLGAYDRTYSPNYPDFVVSKLSGDLSELMASTYLGGRFEEAWGGAKVDPSGNIIVGGSTESDDYPSTPGAYGELFHGPPQPGQHLHDVVVSKLSNDLSLLLASTFIGTGGFDGGQQITLDSSGNPIIGGHTTAVDYPVTSGALDADHNGENEYMLTKVDNDLATILASTFLTPNDAGFTFLTDLSTDPNGNIYGVGAAWQASCPTTPDAYDRTFNGGENDFSLIKLDGDLTTLVYATFLGGSAGEGDCAVATDNGERVIVAGYTESRDMPISDGAYDVSFNGGTKDAFVAKLGLESDSTRVPVFLADFESHATENTVKLAWRVSESTEVDDFRLVGYSEGQTWELSVVAYSRTEFGAEDRDPRLRRMGSITYRLHARVEGGGWGALWTERVDMEMGARGFSAGPARPNPFRTLSTLSFKLGTAQSLDFEVYDAAGRRVALLARRAYTSGSHTIHWDGRNWRGQKVPAGIYVLRVRGNTVSDVRKFVVMR